MLDIGLEIRILRERLKVSAKELAARVGLSQSQISRLEKGQRRIDADVLRRIASALGVDPSHFFRDEHGVDTSAAPLADDAAIAAPVPAALGQLIRSERRRRHVSAEDLAAKIGKPKAVLQNIEDGKREADPEVLDKIVRALKLGPGVLLGAQRQAIKALEAQVTRLSGALAQTTRGELSLANEDGEERRPGVPVIGALGESYPVEFDAAGRPIGDVVDYVYLPELEHEAAFALHVVGDSMETYATPCFREGDLVIFAEIPLRSRDFAFVRLSDGSTTFRQVFFEAGGRVRLQPLNLSYPSQTCARESTVGSWRLVGYVAKL